MKEILTSRTQDELIIGRIILTDTQCNSHIVLIVYRIIAVVPGIDSPITWSTVSWSIIHIYCST